MSLDVEKIMDLMPLEKGELIINEGIREGLWLCQEMPPYIETNRNHDEAPHIWGRYTDADGDAYLTCPITIITNRGVYTTEMLAYLGQMDDGFFAEGIHSLCIKPDSMRRLDAIVDRKLGKIEAAKTLGVNFVTIRKYDDGTLLQIPSRDHMPLNGMNVFEFGEQRKAEIMKEYSRQAKIAESFGFYTKGIVTSSGELYLMLL
jgi:hypothetical protein